MQRARVGLVVILVVAVAGLASSETAFAESSEPELPPGQGFFNSYLPVTLEGPATADADGALGYVAGAGSGFSLSLDAAFLKVERHYWKYVRVTNPADGDREEYAHNFGGDTEEVAFIDAVAHATGSGDGVTLLAYAPDGDPLPAVQLTAAPAHGLAITGAAERVLGMAGSNPDVAVGDGERYRLEHEVAWPHLAAAGAGGTLRVAGNFTLYVWDVDVLVKDADGASRTFLTGERDVDETGPVKDTEAAYALLHVVDGVLEVKRAASAEVITPALSANASDTVILPRAVGGFRAGDTKFEATGEDAVLKGDLRIALRLLDGDPDRALADVSGVLAETSLTAMAASSVEPFLKTPVGRAAATGAGLLMLVAGATVLMQRDRVAPFVQRAVPRRFRGAPRGAPRSERVEAAVAALAEGEDAEAVKILEGLVAEEPGNVVLLVDYGCALDRLDRTRAARDAFERAVAEDPANAEAHYYYGRALARLGVSASALTHLQRAIALDARLGEMAGRDAGFRGLSDHPQFIALTR